MGLNYWVGSSISAVRDAALARRVPGLWNRYPRGRVMELDVSRWSRRPLKTIFDIGANQGQTAVEFARWFPKAQIHCFEPVLANFELLRARTDKLNGVAVHHAACGSTGGTQFIRYGVDHERHSLARSGEGNSPADGEVITVVTVDQFCREQGLEELDLLKSDTEGYELDVLQGADALLSRGAIRFVFVEVGLNGQTEHTPFGAILERMKSFRYDFSGFYNPMRAGNQGEILWFANALFTHPSVSASR